MEMIETHEWVEFTKMWDIENDNQEDGTKAEGMLIVRRQVRMQTWQKCLRKLRQLQTLEKKRLPKTLRTSAYCRPLVHRLVLACIPGLCC